MGWYEELVEKSGLEKLGLPGKGVVETFHVGH